MNARFSAADMAKFWQENISQTRGTLSNKSMVDSCLTIHERLFSVEGCEQIVAANEARNGTNSPWNSIWKLQEVIYRCKTASKIKWLMVAIQDALDSGKIAPDEVTVNALKANSRSSLSDMCLQQFKLKSHLLGPWLDVKTQIPSHVKAAIREIFGKIDKSICDNCKVRIFHEC